MEKQYRVIWPDYCVGGPDRKYFDQYYEAYDFKEKLIQELLDVLCLDSGRFYGDKDAFDEWKDSTLEALEAGIKIQETEWKDY